MGSCTGSRITGPGILHRTEKKILTKFWASLLSRSLSQEGVDFYSFTLAFNLPELWARRLFNLMDLDKNGVLSYLEFEMGICILADPLDSKFMKLLCQMFDMDNDNKISLNEFLLMLFHMPISLLREYEHEESIYHLLITYKTMWESPSMLKKELTQLYYQISNNSDDLYYPRFWEWLSQQKFIIDYIGKFSYSNYWKVSRQQKGVINVTILPHNSVLQNNFEIALKSRGSLIKETYEFPFSKGDITLKCMFKMKSEVRNSDVLCILKGSFMYITMLDEIIGTCFRRCLLCQ